jgi:hypothetical protein
MLSSLMWESFLKVITILLINLLFFYCSIDYLMTMHVSQITAKEDKYKKEVLLTGINHKHPDYMAFKPEKRVQEPVVQDMVVAESSVTKQLEVIEIYKPSSHVKPIFVAVEAGMEKYYSGPEASDVVFRFVVPLSITFFCGDEVIDFVVAITSHVFMKCNDSGFLLLSNFNFL